MKIRKVSSILCVICILLSLSGCKEATTSPKDRQKVEKAEENVCFLSMMVGTQTQQKQTDSGTLCSVTWETLRLPETEREKYPKVHTFFEAYNAEQKAESDACMEELIRTAEELAEYNTGRDYLERERKIFVQRADSLLVSFMAWDYQYSGGAHPNYVLLGNNFDPQTGDTVRLTDVVSDYKKLPDILEKIITETYGDVTFEAPSKMLAEYAPEAYMWTMDYEGITFWFSPYEIAPYIVGPLSAKIYFDAYPDLFNEKYRKTPGDGYAIALPIGMEMGFDRNAADGETDRIQIDKRLDREGYYHMLSVTVNGETGTDEIYSGFDFEVYLVRVGEKNYIYADSLAESDYHIFVIWDINGPVPKQTEAINRTKMETLFMEESFDTVTHYRAVLNNPMAFRLETHFDILGTRSATANYQAAEKDGVPQMTDTVYTFQSGADITSIRPLMVEVLPDMQKEELPAGTVFSVRQTDGETYADAVIPDGRTVRLHVDLSEWPRMVGGISEWECFHSLPYAG